MKYFFFLSLLITINLLQAQDVSNEAIVKDKMGSHYLVTKNKLIRLNLNSIKIFDVQSFFLEKEISLKKFPKNWIPIELLQFQDKVLLFYKATPENNKFYGYYHLYCQEIDIEKEKLTKAPKLVTGLPQEFSSGVTNEHKIVYFPKPASIYALNYPFVKIKVSQDSSKLIISNAGFHGIVFNTKMEPIHSYAISDFSDNKNLIPIGETIDNQENYYAIAKLYEFEDEFNYASSENFSKYDYNLVYLHSKVNGEKIITHKNELKGNQITCATIKTLSNGKLVCVGAYANNQNESVLEHGFFSFYISDMESLTKIPFTGNQFRRDDILKKQNKVKALLNSINIFEDEDGEILVIGERIAFDEKISISGFVSYQDILVIKLDEKLNKIWLHRLPKNVSYSNMDYGGGSYAYNFTKGAHYILFLDNKANFSKDIDEKPVPCHSSINGNLIAYCIEEYGNVKKIFLYENFSNEKGLQIHTIKPISDTKIIFDNCISKNKSVLTKLLLQKS